MNDGERLAWLAARAREEELRARMTYAATWAALHPGGRTPPEMTLGASTEIRALSRNVAEAAVRQLILERRASWFDPEPPATG